MGKVKVGVIGTGYWGPNLVRNFVEIQETEMVAVADLDSDRLSHVGRRYPQIEHLTTDYRELFKLGLDAVVICTPPQTHHAIAADCLANGLHVFIEKPLTTSTESAHQLIALAKQHDRILMVGHTFEYNPAVKALRQIVASGELGDVLHIEAVRASLGLFHPSVNVIWDLAPHDLSILMYVLGEPALSVSARGVTCLQDSVEDIAYLLLQFPNNIKSHVQLSWLDPIKTRRISIVGTEKMVVYDEMSADAKIKVYDKRVTKNRREEPFGTVQFDYHNGDVTIPHIKFEEPLRIECSHFAQCIIDGTKPNSDGQSGLRVVEVIEAAQRSLRNDGRVEAVVSDLPAVVGSVDSTPAVGNGSRSRGHK